MKRLIFAVFFLSIFCASVYAETNDIKDFAERFVKKIDAKFISYHDMGELFEVVFEAKGKKGILYLTKDRQYIIIGAVVTKEGKNLTKERLQSLNKVRFSDIPLDSAIAIHKGNGKKKLVMFTDIDCPHCRKAFEWLETKTDYSLYVFLSPIERLHPKARGKSIQVLCSDNPAVALADAKKGIPLKITSCEAGERALAKHVLVSQIIGVKGTPLFVFEDGRILEGFNEAELARYVSGMGDL